MTEHPARPASPLPQPPFSAELLADFDAGVLDADTTGHIEARLADDPGAARILAALAATRATLAGAALPTDPIPPGVAHRIAETLGNIKP